MELDLATKSQEQNKTLLGKGTDSAWQDSSFRKQYNYIYIQINLD